MALTVAEISKLAFDGVESAITDAVHVAVLTGITRGAYNTATGAYTETPLFQNGRMVVETERPASDIFPDYVVGSRDELMFLEGFTSCEEGWGLSAVGETWVITQTQDVLAAGSAFYVVARRK